MEVLELKDVKAVPDIIHNYPYKIRDEAIPLVVDNGKRYIAFGHFHIHTNLRGFNIFSSERNIHCRFVQL